MHLKGFIEEKTNNEIWPMIMLLSSQTDIHDSRGYKVVIIKQVDFESLGFRLNSDIDFPENPDTRNLRHSLKLLIEQGRIKNYLLNSNTLKNLDEYVNINKSVFNRQDFAVDEHKIEGHVFLESNLRNRSVQSSIKSYRGKDWLVEIIFDKQAVFEKQDTGPVFSNANTTTQPERPVLHFDPDTDTFTYGSKSMKLGQSKSVFDPARNISKLLFGHEIGQHNPTNIVNYTEEGYIVGQKIHMEILREIIIEKMDREGKTGSEELKMIADAINNTNKKAKKELGFAIFKRKEGNVNVITKPQ